MSLLRREGESPQEEGGGRRTRPVCLSLEESPEESPGESSEESLSLEESPEESPDESPVEGGWISSGG